MCIYIYIFVIYIYIYVRKNIMVCFIGWSLFKTMNIGKISLVSAPCIHVWVSNLGLALQALRAGKLRFPVRPKMHSLEHMMLLQHMWAIINIWVRCDLFGLVHSSTLNLFWGPTHMTQRIWIVALKVKSWFLLSGSMKKTMQQHKVSHTWSFVIGHTQDIWLCASSWKPPVLPMSSGWGFHPPCT